MTLRGLLLLLVLTLQGCTPLGIWVYTEPTVEVAQLSVSDADTSAYPVRVSLQVSNANDFDVSLEAVELVLVLDGSSVIDRELSTAALLSARDRQTVEIGVAWRDVGAGLRPSGLRSGELQYHVSGAARIRTPIGKRRIRFARAGLQNFARGAGPG
ncbi:MAG TPA: LEA type 2 family protein [Glycomyces sp.]|nr:LEA type 2 family protein [Glycomyces sp.]